MKLKELEPKVIRSIKSERKKRLAGLIKEKRLELDAAKSVYEKLQNQYDDLLERDVDDFVFPHELPANYGCRCIV